MAPTPSTPQNPERPLPLGWNALVNHAKKEVLVCGFYKTPGKSFSTLEILTKPSLAEITAFAAEVEYKVVYPPTFKSDSIAPLAPQG